MKIRFKYLYFVILIWLLSACSHTGELDPATTDFVIDVYDKGRAFNGTTLFADNTHGLGRARIVEVDMDGSVVWQYKIPLRFFRGNVEGGINILMDVKLIGSGNILFVIHGTGVFEVDRNGKVIWSHLDTDASHDADRLLNGNTIYVRGWVQKGMDSVIEVDSTGNAVWMWNGLEEFDVAPYSEISRHGWMHVNAVTRLKNGNTLISIRNFHTVVEVDRSGKVVWRQDFSGDKRLGIFRPEEIKGVHNHDPELLPGNTMLVAVRQPHKVYEINRDTGKIVWEWQHPQDRSHTIRDVDRLPNGNTLIQDNNKLIEVAKNGDIVWQLRVKHLQYKPRTSKSLYKAQRIGQ